MRVDAALAAGRLNLHSFAATTPGEPPTIQMHVLPAYVVNSGRTKVPGFGVTINTCVVRPKSRGSVTLASSDPGAMPRIDPNFHGHPDDRAQSIMGVRLAREILAQPALAKYISAERFPGRGKQTDAEILEYIKEYASVDYHPVGTCKMGIGEDAVVDPQLRVRGIDNLRVVDSSIMPNLISGNTNAPSIMIGEKGAALIRNEAPVVALTVGQNTGRQNQQMEMS
mgnify:CR=1 FL=1